MRYSHSPNLPSSTGWWEWLISLTKMLKWNSHNTGYSPSYLRSSSLTYNPLWHPSCQQDGCPTPYLGGQLLLPIHQALDVCGVVAAALAGRHRALEGRGRNLRGNAGGGAESSTAQTGRQRVTQGLGDAVTKLLTKQKEMSGFFHLVRKGISIVCSRKVPILQTLNS